MRLTIKILVATGIIGLVSCWALEFAESCGASLFSDIRAKAESVSRERRQRDEFDSHVTWIVSEFAASRLSLPQASRLMESTARECWPQFLTYAQMIDAPGSLRVKLAYNLLLEFRYETSRCASERLQEMEREYQALAGGEEDEL